MPFLVDRPLHALDPATGEVVPITQEEEEAIVDKSRIVPISRKFKDFFKLDNVKQTIEAGFKYRDDGK